MSGGRLQSFFEHHPSYRGFQSPISGGRQNIREPRNVPVQATSTYQVLYLRVHLSHVQVSRPYETLIMWQGLPIEVLSNEIAQAAPITQVVEKLTSYVFVVIGLAS